MAPLGSKKQTLISGILDGKIIARVAPPIESHNCYLDSAKS